MHATTPRRPLPPLAITPGEVVLAIALLAPGAWVLARLLLALLLRMWPLP